MRPYCFGGRCESDGTCLHHVRPAPHTHAWPGSLGPALLGRGSGGALRLQKETKKPAQLELKKGPPGLLCALLCLPGRMKRPGCGVQTEVGRGPPTGPPSTKMRALRATAFLPPAQPGQLGLGGVVGGNLRVSKTETRDLFLKTSSPLPPEFTLTPNSL